MARPKRIDQTDLLNEIKSTAWQQITENGAAALSLRAIARALHITAPAIYNYYPSRDDLVTVLIVDAYTSLGDAQFSAFQGLPVNDHPARLRELGLAYRQWALTYPQRYQLIFGTPIPGYHAPQEITTPAASRSLVPLIGCLDAACIDDKLRIPQDNILPESLSKQLDDWRQVYPVAHIYVLYATLVICSRVYGMVSMEIGNQFPFFIEDINAFYQSQIERLIEEHLIV